MRERTLWAQHHTGGASHTHGGHSHTEHSHSDHADGEHTHGEHSHTHDPKEMKKIRNRLARAVGHLDAVRKMVEREEDCAEVLIQLSAVRSEITNAGKLLLKEHLDHCIVDAVETKDREAILRMNEAIDKFMK